MKKSSLYKILGIWGCLIIFVFSTIAMAASYSDLYPYLKKLPGWKADPPTGASVQLPDLHLITATRAYQKGKKTITAMIMIGPQALASWLPYAEGFKLDTPNELVTTQKIKDFYVQIIYDKQNHSGGILVELSAPEDNGSRKAAAFHLSFNSMKPEEALKIAEKFDWKGMQKAVEKLTKNKE